MQCTYWDRFKEIISNKKLCFFVIFTTIACFGFTITNFSIGVDDPAAFHYLSTNHLGSMIQQGRLLHVLYNKLTSSLEFLPFINDLLGASLLALSSLLFCALFQLVTNGKLSTLAMTVFCCVFISTPIINEKFIYNLDTVVTMASYCTCALSLTYTYSIPRSKVNIFMAVGMLMLSIASYETFGFLYFCGVFAIFILRIVVNNEKISIKMLFLDGIKYAVVLSVAFALYYGLVNIVQRLTGQYGVFIRNSGWLEVPDGIVNHFFSFTKDIAKTFLLSDHLPIIIFTYTAIFGFILFSVLSILKRNAWLIISFCAFFAGNLIIHYVCGYVMNRAAQTFCLFCAFVVMILVITLPRNLHVQRLIVFGAVLLVLVQTVELNRWFYNDYIRYQKEAFTTNSIAKELLEECDLSKPVVFTGSGLDGYLNNNYYSGDQVNGNSVIYWSVATFGEYDSPMMLQLFRMHGYDFLIAPSKEQADQAAIIARDRPAWPVKGYIVETEEFIVVKVN